MQAYVWVFIGLGVVLLVILHYVWRYYYLKKVQALNRQNDQSIWLTTEEVILLFVGRRKKKVF